LSDRPAADWEAAERGGRPALVTWLSVGVITLAGVQVAGLLGSLQLPDLPYAAPPAYLAVRSGLWAIWGLASAVAALFGRGWAPTLLRAGGAVLAVWYLADRLLLARSDFARQGLPEHAALTLVLLGTGLWILGRPEVRAFFEENRT
jgi:hypothetical protein